MPVFALHLASQRHLLSPIDDRLWDHWMFRRFYTQILDCSSLVIQFCVHVIVFTCSFCSCLNIHIHEQKLTDLNSMIALLRNPYTCQKKIWLANKNPILAFVQRGSTIHSNRTHAWNANCSKRFLFGFIRFSSYTNVLRAFIQIYCVCVLGLYLLRFVSLCLKRKTTTTTQLRTPFCLGQFTQNTTITTIVMLWKWFS